jgi:Secretion system C-terminal sorting domain
MGRADFTGTTVTPKADGSIEINVKVKPLQQLPLTTKLYVGILETKFNTPATLPAGTKITTGETSFEYVLKKLLPSAVGTSVGTLLQNNVNNSVVDLGTLSWTPSRFYSSRYSVVVFLQDELTKEVYQAELNPGILPPNDYLLPGPVTGLEPLSPESVNLYPNPANQEFVIELPNALSVDSNISLVDQMGKTIDGGILPAGRTNKSVGTYDLAAGVYIVQIKTDGGDVVRKKVVIVH